MNYILRRKAEINRRALRWQDNSPLSSPKRTSETRFPIRVDHKTVIWVRESKLDQYFPLALRKESLEEYKAKYIADPQNFAY